jgi:predicted nuclease of restriction endonuclease-like (RecB) superfamily
MSKNKQIEVEGIQIFDRVVSILEQSRGDVVYSVNYNMVRAYWLIGREIVKEIQNGEERAEYGKQIIEELSSLLNKKYKKGFSVTNLRYYRQFYLTFKTRSPIHHPVGGELQESKKIHHPGGESLSKEKQNPESRELMVGFNPKLTWSHYRALMRVKNKKAMDFYEKETVECGWSKSQLERQIQTSYYERIIANHGEQGLLPEGRERLVGEPLIPVDILKSPMVLEFLDLPDNPSLHENRLEDAIIGNLQLFLLELGKGFSFVARQKNINFDDDNFYIDLVFYNFILKCFVLIDLKIGKLTHKDVGQMDGYVRLFEDKYKIEGDNPTIGLILCSDKSEAVARYSVLSENKQIFASKYLKYLPSEEELRLEIEKERNLIEAAQVGENDLTE